MSVIFEQLRVSGDSRKMYIDAHVGTASYFENRYITTVIIKTAEQITKSGLSPETSDGDNVYSQSFDEGTKEIHLVLEPNKDFNVNFTKQDFSSDLFFIYVICDDTLPDPCTPCEYQNLTTIGVFFDEKVIYQRVMQFTKELADTCSIPSDFMDLILLWNAYKAAVETGHYLPAIKYWEMLFGGSGDREIASTYRTFKNCGCHG